MPVEFLASFVNPNLVANPIAVSAGVGFVRSIIGWLEGVATDWTEQKSLRKPDLGKLIKTLLRVIPQSICMGIVIPGGEVAAIGTDYFLEKGRKPKKK